MTRGFEDSAAGERAFWGVDSAGEELVLREDGAPRIYDLEERTARFGERIVIFAKKTPRNPVNNRLIDPLVGAGTSTGANYCEADDGVSKPDFRNRIGTCRKEARETKFFLRMVAIAEPKMKEEARDLWREAHALHRIFTKIWRTTRL